MHYNKIAWSDAQIIVDSSLSGNLPSVNIIRPLSPHQRLHKDSSRFFNFEVYADLILVTLRIQYFLGRGVLNHMRNLL